MNSIKFVSGSRVELLVTGAHPQLRQENLIANGKPVYCIWGGQGSRELLFEMKSGISNEFRNECGFQDRSTFHQKNTSTYLSITEALSWRLPL